MSQELISYIYILEEKKESSHTLISFEPTVAAAKKTLQKLVSRKKTEFESAGAKVYITKSSNKTSITLFRAVSGYLYNSGLVQETTISIKRVPSRPSDSCDMNKELNL
jgi:hypothetical protein